MKKTICLFILLYMMIALCGCSLADNDKDSLNTQMGDAVTSESEVSQEAEQVIVKDVVFLNVVPQRTSIGIECSALEQVNLLCRPCYEYDESQNEDTLYAFSVSMHIYREKDRPEDYPIQKKGETYKEYSQRRNIYEKKLLVEIMYSQGIYILSDSLKVEEAPLHIACTMDDLVRVFDDATGPHSKWGYTVSPVFRQDMRDIMRRYGWKEEERDIKPWFDENYERLQEELGTQTQITIPVEVE